MREGEGFSYKDVAKKATEPLTELGVAEKDIETVSLRYARGTALPFWTTEARDLFRRSLSRSSFIFFDCGWSRAEGMLLKLF